MTVARDAGEAEPQSDGRRPEPRWLTLADLGVIVAGVALAMTIPSRAPELLPFLAPRTALLRFVVLGGLRLTLGFGLMLALVLVFRHGRYGAPVRPAEWLALLLAAHGLVNVVPDLDAAVNAYYAAVGSNALNFGLARWLMSVPAALGVVMTVAFLAVVRRRARAGSRFASALSVVGIVGGLFMWFWGPCAVARLELPWIVVPSPDGDPSSWGWRGPVVFALRELVANGLVGLTWGLPAAATVRARRYDSRRNRSRGWIWTEWAAVVGAVVAALLTVADDFMMGRSDVVWLAPFWIASVGFASWWITGALGVWSDQIATTLRPAH